MRNMGIVAADAGMAGIGKRSRIAVFLGQLCNIYVFYSIKL